MSEQSFEELLNQEGSLNRIHTGSIVSGTVIDVKDNEIVLNIGYKADGIVPKYEYSNDPSVNLKEAVQVGDVLEVKVLKVNDGDGQVALSYKRLSSDRANKVLEEAFEAGTVLSGTVEQGLKAGLTVDCEGTKVFIPASLVSDNFENDLSKYVGKTVEFKLIEYSPRRRRIVGDRKQLVAAQKAEALKELLDRIEVGMIVNGKVKSLTDFGAFIDLGGADGLLHISEMSWGRIDNPKKLYKVGDEVEAYVKEIKEDKIALSVKYPENNPWTEDSPYLTGNIVKGKVARMTDFGAFVELEPGIDGLLYVSNIAHERVEKPQDVLKVGQELELKVIDFMPEDHKISLSRKALLPEPEVPTQEAAPAEETPAEETPAEAEAPVETAAPEEVTE